MNDKLYSWLYGRSIRKYNKQSLNNLYIATKRAYVSGQYTGLPQHKLKLQLNVLSKKVGKK